MPERLEGAQFRSPEEEIRYLRERIAVREREMLKNGSALPEAERAALAKEELKAYGAAAPEAVLPESRRLPQHETVGMAEELKSARNTVEHVIQLAEEHGIKNVLGAIERFTDNFLVDAAHDALVAHLRVGR